MPKWLKISAGVLALTVFLGAFMAWLFWRIHHPQPLPQQALINGVILTLDEHDTVAEAVLLEGDRIKAIGSSKAIQAMVNHDDAQITDLAGHTVIPGFIEAHGHFPGAGLKAIVVDLNSPPIGNTSTIQQGLAALKRKAETTASGDWIIGMGYDDTLLNPKRHFNRTELDAISTDHPILLMHISGHMGVANSKALAIGGWTKDSKAPKGGELGWTTNGELNGLLKETAFEPLRTLAFDFDLLTAISISRAATEEYLRYGVTTVQNGLTHEHHLGGLSTASKLGLIPMRVMIWPDDKLGAKILAGKIDTTQHTSPIFTIGAVKLVADGSIQGYTGFLNQPYAVPPAGEQADYRGYPTMTAPQLQAQVQQFHAAGQQLAIHANGDGAIDMVIDAFAGAQAETPEQDPRLVVIHAQMATDSQLQRMQALGMTPSFFSAHTYYWGDRHRDQFMGAERAARISPAASAERLGLRYSIHTDTPVVPIRPMQLVWSAAHRQTSSGQTLGAAQQVSVLDALKATTIDAAWQIKQEDNRGSIEAGKYADLLILSADPRHASADNLKDIRVLQTMIGGVVRYRNWDKTSD